jgi:multiple sugar transport system permease protein
MPIIPEVIHNRQNRIARVFVYVLATVWLFAMLFPLYYTIVMATAPRAATIEVPPRLYINLAKVAYISLDLTPFVKDHLDLSADELETAIKGEIGVAATRPLFLDRELAATHVIASFNGQVIAETEISSWLLTKYYPQWINQGADRVRKEANAFFEYFNIRFDSQVLGGMVTKSAPWYATPKSGSLAERVYNEVKGEGSLQGNWSLTIKNSLNHMLDGLRQAIGPKELWTHFTVGSVPRWFFNSLVYAFGVIFAQLSVSALAGYALSRLWPRKLSYVLEMFFLATLMLPAILLFLPMVLMMQNFPFPTIPFTAVKLPGVNLMNTYWAMILPHTAWAFSILLFRGFFDQLPDELFQAARIDGANEMDIFLRIAFPLSRPIFATMTIFTFLAIWSEFLWPYLVASKQAMWTLSIGLFSSSGAGGGTGGDPILSMSMALISALPPLLIFLFFQRYLVRGIALTGLKG